MTYRPTLALLLATLLFGACGGSDNDSQEEPIVFDQGSGDEEASTEETPDEGSEGTTSEGELVVSDDACETDADCVPAGCCHPAACASAANAPDCSDTMCTADCQFGTLDCGGSCLCHEGRCAARLSQAPEIEQPAP